MDQDTRNQIQNATQDARELLEEEYAAQLEGTYDILPDGTIPEKPGEHLDGRGRITREKLVEAIEHKISGGMDADQAVAAYRREAAFTTLNRFVALKMLESRDLVQECVSRGEQSAGFREFTGLAEGLNELPDHGYRLYIESLFDEIGREVGVLFDRRDPASLLWPRRQVLEDLLDILNADELEGVWDEDETIGWVYQYFNSGDERSQMRSESSAPRNSHELAVRNQFFTPRYVVEFLTDNTLGRIWYEMRRGETDLTEQCDYMVRRPNEVFLDEGEEPPEDADQEDEDLSQEELLQKPAYIPFRALKDPRDIRVLDPACGSGHFLLYAFVLLLTIYREAWESGSGPESEATGSSLHEDYSTWQELQRDLPGLILRHNLHGIEIDHRAAQIASLALWMRAQRAYNEQEIPRADRPPITRTNVVVAEPMPGEKDMLEEFLRELREDRLEGLMEQVFDVPEGGRLRATRAMADSLCELVETVWEKMELAGEAGSLLKIEEELDEAIAESRNEWEQKLPLFRVTELNIEGEEKEHYPRTAPGAEDDFWSKAEMLVLAALEQYAERARNDRSYRRRLFAEEAAHAFAFVDVCRQNYDVALMNPPFGAPTTASKPHVAKCYSKCKEDIDAAFVSRGVDLLA
ncbi:MAG: DNA methyltransferase [Candidatus Brocadiia bacterium]